VKPSDTSLDFLAQVNSLSLISQCKKDQRAIDVSKVETYCLQDSELNVQVTTKFSKETAGHFCCKNGHADILAKLLSKHPEAAACLDDQGNTLLHALMNVRFFLVPDVSLELCEQSE